jgi:hypothetical protein
MEKRQDVTYKDKYGATITIKWSALDAVPERELRRRQEELNRLAQELRIKYAARAQSA